MAHHGPLRRLDELADGCARHRGSACAVTRADHQESAAWHGLLPSVVQAARRAFVHRSDAAASSIRQVPIASAGRAKRGVKGHCDCGAAARPTAAYTGHSLRVQQKHELCAARQPSAWRQAAVSGGRGGLRQRRLESLGRPSRPALVAFARRRCHRERRTTAALDWPYSPRLGIIRGGVWRALDGASAGGRRRCR
jgi:hypothetical protein